jgi:hypothetical protein
VSVFARAMCRAGRHAGEWSLPDGRCMSYRNCDRCGELESKTLHAWGPFEYTASGRCDQSRRCERCRATESRVRHEWGPWLYSNLEQNSPQQRECKRCHEVERTRYTLR